VSIAGTRVLFPPDSWRFRGGRIDVAIGEPIPTTEMGPDDVDALLSRSRAAILAGLPPEYAPSS